MLRELIALDNTSKVWIYQADRELSYDEIDEIRPLIFEFVDSWSSHGVDVPAYGNIFHRRFLALFADESNYSGVSGCSIDSSVAFVRQLSENLNVDFFNRMLFSYMQEEEIFCASQDAINQSIQEGRVNGETLFFDNLVDSKEKFLKTWLVPLQDSWHSRMFVL